jgi:hypothetical protein
MMVPNPITNEIRGIRHRLATQFDNDVYRIGADLRRREAVSGRRVVRLPRRQPIKTTNHAMQRSGGGGVSDNGGSTPAAR